jgi:hypothetical protein
VPRKKKPQRIGVIDAETDPFEPGQFVAPFIWGVLLATGEYFEFLTTALLIEWLLREENEGLTLYAHNGGKFDYHFLRDAIESDEPISVVAGRLARCKIGGVELRDSLNLFGQTRLADFSKEEIDYLKMRRDVRHLHMPEIRTYLKADCVSLLTLVSRFIEKYGMQFTQAGAAMKYWRKHYAPRETSEKGDIPQSTPAFYEKFSPFYYGGRVQCFANGYEKRDFKVVDINSAYPRAMIDAHPYSTVGIQSTRLPKNEARIPQCLIELDAVAKGCFPLRVLEGPQKNSLFFPEDERQVRRYTITGWEYLAALRTNTVQVHKIHRVYSFGEPVNFSGYVNHFFTERANAKLAGDKAEDIFCKIFMNGLYGKWASNPSRYREYVLSDRSSARWEQWERKGFEDKGEWGGRQMLVRALPLDKQKYYNIATAASITGWVRAYLWESLLKTDNPLYCDTDSIAAVDVSRLDLGKQLGQWKLEAECDEYAIAGKKNYAFHIAGAARPVDVRRQKPLTRRESQKEWEELRKCWKVASKGADLSPQEMIAVAAGFEVMNRANVPNFSIHRDKFTFIDRMVRSTYKDIAHLDIAA